MVVSTPFQIRAERASRAGVGVANLIMWIEAELQNNGAADIDVSAYPENDVDMVADLYRAAGWRAVTGFRHLTIKER